MTNARTLWSSFPIAGLLLLLGTTPHADAAEPADDPQIIGVLMYADWCGTRQALDPKLEAVKKDSADASILFPQFDKTDAFTTRQAALYASWTGLDRSLLC